MSSRKFLALAFLLWVAFAQAQNSATIQVVGVGSTFPTAMYSFWFQEFEKTHPNSHFQYMPMWSGVGIKMVKSGTADFGATEAPMTDKEALQAKVLHLPTVIGAIVPVYHVADVVKPLRFSPGVLAGIYLGKITRWNDPALSNINPDAHLPARAIQVVCNGAGRGATYIWSDYLSKVSVEWRDKVGRGISVNWPVGKVAQGNGNVANLVKTTPDSIGYVELGYATRSQLPIAQVQNAAGNFVMADFASTIAAAEATKTIPADLRVSITNPPGAKSYPIASFTWLLFPEQIAGEKKQAAIKEFLLWMLSTGQQYPESVGFAPLPQRIIQEELKTISKMR